MLAIICYKRELAELFYLIINIIHCSFEKGNISQSLLAKAMNSEGCETLKEFSINVYDNPKIEAFKDTTICQNSDYIMTPIIKYLGDDELSKKGIGRLNVLDLQVQIRRTPKPVVAMVAGWAIGGGHVLHAVCDLTIAAENAKFGQTGPMVGSFDGGYGAGLLAAHVGQKKAREIWFLCRQYDAQEALDMGLVNAVVPVKDLEAETVSWAREMLRHSPMALRLLKAGLNAADDGLAGVQQLAGDATLLFYLTEEGQEGRNAYQEKREPNFDKFPKRP